MSILHIFLWYVEGSATSTHRLDTPDLHISLLSSRPATHLDSSSSSSTTSFSSSRLHFSKK